jgi:hypothetical protein
MRLDFNVLWVEDQPAAVDAQIRPIRKMMADQGFEFKPTICETLEEVQQYLADDVFTDEVDLVIVDWDLRGGAKGQEAIVRIRDPIPYKDVIFYSARTDVDALRRIVFEQELEGVYCVTRAELVTEVEGVFESLVKKVLDIDHTRGIVMGATSDIDHISRDCLSAIHELLDDKSKEVMVAEALQTIKKKIEEISAVLSELEKQPTIEAILEQHRFFTAHDGLWMLSRALKREPMKGKHGAFRRSVVEYMQHVGPERTVLAHQVLRREEKTVVLDGRGQEVSVERMRELRCRLLELRSDFRSLQRALRGR